MTAPVPARPDLELLRIEVDKFRAAETAAITEYGYSRDWMNFCAWCKRTGCVPLPASSETLCLFIADQLTNKKVSTACRRAAAVCSIHQRAGYPSPSDNSVRQLLRGARRIRAEQPRQMRPLSVLELRQVAGILSEKRTRIATRNCGIVVVAFASALRRSNISMLRMEDVTFCAEGFIILVRKEKNDPQSVGRLIPMPHGSNELTCPVRALKAWLALRGSQKGPLFTRLDSNRKSETEALSFNAIGKIVKKAIAATGIDAALSGCHSLRAGLITEAGIAGVSPLVIAATSGHRSLDSLKDYFRPIGLFKACAAGQIGL